MIRILTDSASDILPAEAATLGVDVIPLNVTLEDGTVIRDGVDLTPSEYYAHMAACKKLPTTSQPSPELFEKFEALLVRLAVQLRDIGKSAVQIAATLEHAKEHLHLVAAIDDLKYLRKGGRLPAAVAVAGGMLGIKPLITLKEGKVAMAGKARGLPGAYVALFKKIEELGGINPRFDSLAGYTVSTREVAPIQTYLVDNLGLPEPLVRQIGCVIGTHAGPGAFGLAFFDNGLIID